MAKKELPVLQTTKPQKLKYDCAKCPGYCCTYTWIKVLKTDIKRLAKGFGLTYEQAEKKFTRYVPEYKNRVLRHQPDELYGTACRFLHPTERRCTIYEHRPQICRDHPEEGRCGYFDFLQWERKHQQDPEFIPLVYNYQEAWKKPAKKSGKV